MWLALYSAKRTRQACRRSGFAAALAISVLWVGSPLLAQTAEMDALASLVRARRYQDAIVKADELIRRNAGSSEAWFYRGIAQNGLGDEHGAVIDLKHALAIDPALLKAAEAGAQIAYRANDLAARTFLEQVIVLEPANPTAHAMLGVLALEANDCSTALQHFHQAGSNADATIAKRVDLCKAQVAANAGDFSAAETSLNTVHQANPADSNVTRRLAEVLMQENQPAKVISLLTSSAGTPASSLNLLASAYAQLGQLSLAIETYRRAIESAPLAQENYLDLATLGMDHQSPEVALSVLESGLRVNPQAARLLVMRGTVFAQIGKNDLAQKDFEQADRLQPSSTFGALGMGVLLREDGNLDQAQTVLEKKLEVTPGNALLSFMLADVLVRKGASPGEASFTRATSLLQEAIATQPSLAPAHALLGKLLLKDDYPDQATAELETAIRLQPTDRSALNQLVSAYRRVGRTADAARVSATLERSVAAERAQENEKNRIHLSLSGQTATTGAPDTPPSPAKAPAQP